MTSPVLPALISRPFLDVPNDPTVFQTLQQDLTSGLPAKVDLDGARGLVLAVPLGVARNVLSADPATVAFDTGSFTGPTTPRDYDATWPRLTFVAGGVIGETVPVLPGVRFAVRLGADASVEITVDTLVVTVGTLRSPGQFGSRLALRWRALGPAPDAGPPPSTGDPSIPIPNSTT